MLVLVFAARFKAIHGIHARGVFYFFDPPRNFYFLHVFLLSEYWRTCQRAISASAKEEIIIHEGLKDGRLP